MFFFFFFGRVLVEKVFYPSLYTGILLIPFMFFILVCTLLEFLSYICWLINSHYLSASEGNIWVSNPKLYVMRILIIYLDFSVKYRRHIHWISPSGVMFCEILGHIYLFPNFAVCPPHVCTEVVWWEGWHHMWDMPPGAALWSF